ncbi:MAG: hypothetical protein OEM32_03805 [Acidimicrobiia bacterium]|nr:hypothetical protein [Acidimicrobiia bacterium]
MTSVWIVRIGILVLIATAVGIAVVPILVMLDLLDGGTGWGLCPEGLEACDLPYTTPFEFGVVLVLSLFAVVLAIRLLVRLARRLQADSYLVNEPGSPPPPG